MQRAHLLGLVFAVGFSGAAMARDGFQSVQLSEAANDAALAAEIGAVLAGSIDRANAADPDNPVKVIASPAGADKAVVLLSNNSALCKPEGCLMVVFNKTAEGWAPFWGVHANGWVELAEKAKADTVAYVESRQGCQIMMKGDDGSGRPMMGATYPWPCAGHDSDGFEKGWSAVQKAARSAASVCRSEVDGAPVADSFDATVKITLKKGESACLKRELNDIASLSGEMADDAQSLTIAYRPAVGAAYYHQTPGFDLSLPGGAQ